MAVAVSITTFSQKTWNFSLAPFGATPTVAFASTFTVDGLTDGTDGSALLTLDANGKSLDGLSFTHRLKSGEGESMTAETACKEVLLKAGASLQRDTVDRRIVREFELGNLLYLQRVERK